MNARKAVFSAVNRLLPGLWELAQSLHQNPELSGEEFLAQKKLVNYLQDKGFQCQDQVAGLKTAFVAHSGTMRRPAVAFVAEYDALPGLGHACGHNMIAASAVGTAVALLQAFPELAGKVAVIGTPAEEVPEPPAKQLMLDAGAFDGIDVVMMMHGSDRTCTGAKSLAVNSVEFEFKGKPTHASKFPHLGRSALDGALLTCTALEFLREHVRQDVRIHGVFTDGGLRPNIVPESAKLHYFIRALDRSYLDKIEERVFNCARAGALATDTEVTIRVKGKNDNKILLPTLDRVLLKNAKQANPVNVKVPEEELGSTDFGNVSHRIPASTLKVAFVPEGTPGHSREWAEAASKPEAKKAIEVACKGMAATGYQLLTDPELLDRVVAEFKEQAP